jgi:hypothetical protein
MATPYAQHSATEVIKHKKENTDGEMTDALVAAHVNTPTTTRKSEFGLKAKVPERGDGDVIDQLTEVAKDDEAADGEALDALLAQDSEQQAIEAVHKKK